MRQEKGDMRSETGEGRQETETRHRKWETGRGTGRRETGLKHVFNSFRPKWAKKVCFLPFFLTRKEAEVWDYLYICHTGI